MSPQGTTQARRYITDEVTSRRIERVCGADAAWFDNHPLTTWRWRALARGEELEFNLVDRNPAAFRMRVSNLGDGRLMRQLYEDGRHLGGVVSVPGPRGWCG